MARRPGRPGCCRRDPAALRDRRRNRIRRGGRGHRSGGSAARAQQGRRRALGATHTRRREGGPCRLHVRERRLPRAVGRVRRQRAGAAPGVPRTRLSGRLVLGLTAIAVLAIAFGTIHFTRPAWYDRFWYPLRYGDIVRGHARNYHLNPALLAAVIYQESKFN